MLTFIVTVILLVCDLCGCCTTVCACELRSMKCESITRKTVFIRNLLVQHIEFKNSEVDVNIVVNTYPGLKIIAFVNSLGINCPSDTGVTIIGACHQEIISPSVSPIEQANKSALITPGTGKTALIIASLGLFTSIVGVLCACKKMWNFCKRQCCCRVQPQDNVRIQRVIFSHPRTYLFIGVYKLNKR